MHKVVIVFVIVGLTLAAAPARGQDVGLDRFVVNFSDPARPGLLRVNMVNSAIAVRSHTGREVIIEGGRPGNRNRQPPGTDGLRRIDTPMSGLSIEEENNVMTITSRNFSAPARLEIQVPARTNLNLKTVNGGQILVADIEGEIEVTNTNGSVVLENVSGSVVAHATNGRVLASLRDVTPGKPMSFTSMNASLDVTLPANVKANLRMRTDNGEIYSGFEITRRPGSPTIEDNRSRGGLFRVLTDQTINGTINGGGPDFDLRTLNGNIYIRKGK